MTIDMQKIEGEYDKIADNFSLYPEFYEFVAAEFLKYHINKNVRILDFGCGNGNLLKVIFDLGYQNLTGVDLSERNIHFTREKVPSANLVKLEIERDGIAIGEGFDVIFMTEVIEHLIAPLSSLIKLKNALNNDGHLFITFPNKLAFFPLYYLNPIISRLNWWTYLQERMRWFCLPYEMRSTQPIDHSYTPRDVRSFLEHAGFYISHSNGMRLWPMLRIPNWRWTIPPADALESLLRPITPRIFYYRYLFACRKSDSLRDRSV